MITAAFFCPEVFIVVDVWLARRQKNVEGRELV
jgi:hypothetical protein